MMETDLGKAVVVVPWHNPTYRDAFISRWEVKEDSPIIFQEDKYKEGCAATKNAGIQKAYDQGAEVICVLDDDCYPDFKGYLFPEIRRFIKDHVNALKPQQVERVFPTTTPKPRGTPYENTSMIMPVAASMGFWTGVPDLDAIAALQLGPTASVKFHREVIFGKYFPFCGMNFAFTRDWINCAQLINAARWDDIWMGWVWEKVAYENGYCFNLNGPTVYHSRQSDVWQNLREEVKYIQENESLWERIAQAPHGLTAHSLRKLYINPIIQGR